VTNTEHVKELLSAQCPTVFSVSSISDLAEACGIKYEQALSFIDRLRSQGKTTHECLQQLIVCYRPDLLNIQMQQTA